MSLITVVSSIHQDVDSTAALLLDLHRVLHGLPKLLGALLILRQFLGIVAELLTVRKESLMLSEVLLLG